ncbi:MAG: (2Fe-2S)-binding protein [Bdellovibrionaceae bacterium]|nr:(2Fe-2S)-binding protein [Pseudobdellovibrionaceae bacterium]
MGSQKSWIVEIQGRDRIEVSGEGAERRVHFIGCAKLLHFLESQKALHGKDPAQWPLPEGLDHHELLVKELILKLRGQWVHPYQEDEVCHCRTVSLQTVEEAILAGAHSPEAVSRWTSASTSCGTCRPDVARIIAFRLGTK